MRNEDGSGNDMAVAVADAAAAATVPVTAAAADLEGSVQRLLEEHAVEVGAVASTTTWTTAAAAAPLHSTTAATGNGVEVEQAFGNECDRIQFGTTLEESGRDEKMNGCDIGPGKDRTTPQETLLLVQQRPAPYSASCDSETISTDELSLVSRIDGSICTTSSTVNELLDVLFFNDEAGHAKTTATTTATTAISSMISAPLVRRTDSESDPERHVVISRTHAPRRSSSTATSTLLSPVRFSQWRQRSSGHAAAAPTTTSTFTTSSPSMAPPLLLESPTMAPPLLLESETVAPSHFAFESPSERNMGRLHQSPSTKFTSLDSTVATTDRSFAFSNTTDAPIVSGTSCQENPSLPIFDDASTVAAMITIGRMDATRSHSFVSTSSTHNPESDGVIDAPALVSAYLVPATPTSAINTATTIVSADDLPEDHRVNPAGATRTSGSRSRTSQVQKHQQTEHGVGCPLPCKRWSRSRWSAALALLGAAVTATLTAACWSLVLSKRQTSARNSIVTTAKSFHSTEELYLAVDLYLQAVAHDKDPKSSTEFFPYGYPIGSWDVSRVTNFSRLFDATRSSGELASLFASFNEDLSAWNVSSATTMMGMFSGALLFESDLSSWNVALVTDMTGMFKQARKFDSDIGLWDVSSVTSMRDMFNQADSFSGSVSDWNVVRLQDASSLFKSASSFNISLCNWSRVLPTNALVEDMFVGSSCPEASTSVSLPFGPLCHSCDMPTTPLALTSTEELYRAVDMYMADPDDRATVVALGYGYPIGTWNVSLLSNFTRVFDPDRNVPLDLHRASPIPSVFNEDISKWDMSSAKILTGMFAYATAFNGNLSTWNTSSVTAMDYMFAHAVNFNAEIGAWDTSQVTSMAATFAFVEATSINCDLWNVSKVQSFRAMFLSAHSFTSDLSRWDVGLASDTSFMFCDAPSFTSDLKAWNVARVTNMEAMFDSARSFNSDLSLWSVGACLNMRTMFQGAKSFSSSVSAWDVGRVESMRMMFDSALSFNSPMADWNVSRVTNMEGMFAGTSTFNQNLSNWDVSRVTTISNMFIAAKAFDQNLCAWVSLLAPTTLTVTPFDDTRCSSGGDPVLPVGPMCATCVG